MRRLKVSKRKLYSVWDGSFTLEYSTFNKQAAFDYAEHLEDMGKYVTVRQNLYSTPMKPYKVRK